MVKRRRKFLSASNLIIILIVALIGVNTYFFVKDIKTYDYIVETNAFFAPFEFYKNREIVGVDVEIINRVAKKLGKTFEIKNVEFDVIIDNVASGIIADAGAAGITITPAREEKVNFSVPYYNSIQYVIFNKSEFSSQHDDYVLWDEIAGKTLGSQTGSTGYLFIEDEIEDGVLVDTKTKIKGFDSHQLSADAIGVHIIDVAIADELAAKFIIEKNPSLTALPLYYKGENGEDDYPVEEAYAIAVNKQEEDLLAAFNEVLSEMMIKDENGYSEIDKLILKYMGLLDREVINNEKNS